MQSGVNILSEMALKTQVFVKNSEFHTFQTIRFGSNFANMWSKYISKNVWRDFRLLVSAAATVVRKSFNGEFIATNWFSNQAFYVAIADTNSGSQKSLHALFDKYLDHMLEKFEQNHMVQNMQNFGLFGKKWLTIFEKVLTPFWKMFLWQTIIQCTSINWQTIIFHCFKNYVSPTRVTRLKVAPNISDPLSLNEN